MTSSKLQKQHHQSLRNKWMVEIWEKQLQELDRDELILEIIDSWKEQELDGYKQIKI